MHFCLTYKCVLKVSSVHKVIGLEDALFISRLVHWCIYWYLNIRRWGLGTSQGKGSERVYSLPHFLLPALSCLDTIDWVVCLVFLPCEFCFGSSQPYVHLLKNLGQHKSFFVPLMGQQIQKVNASSMDIAVTIPNCEV